MVSFEPRKYTYKTNVKWKEGEKGVTSSEGNSPINIALPENLGGPGGDWSPDELFVGSAEACAMLTFFWLLKDKDVNVVSYESESEGVSQIASKGIFRFIKVTINPLITVANEEDIPIVKEAIKKLDDSCCVSNSLKAEVVIDAKIEVKDKN
jgi:peroxiredoxin-like protein